MQSNVFKKWGLRAAILVLVLMVLGVIGLIFQVYDVIDRIYGGQATVADYAQFETEVTPTVITGVSVLSPDGTEMLANRTVLLDNGKIISISQGENTNANLPEGVLRVDGSGKFLIPGLADSHIHLQRSPNDFLLYVANGVTQVRSMGGSDPDLVLREEIKGGRIGPHFYVSSPSMNSESGFGEVVSAPNWVPGPLLTWFIETSANTQITSNTKEAVKEARAFIEKGHDGLKLYGFLTMESYHAILDVAEELDVPTVGHLPDAMPLSELRTIKLDEIAHIEEIVKALLREFGKFNSQDGDAFLALVNSRKEEIVDDLKANDIAVHSTLWLMESLEGQIFDLESKMKEVQIEYANPGIVEGHPDAGTGWLPGLNKFPTYAGETPEEIEENKEFWEVREKAHHILLNAMIEQGVSVLAATDSNGWLIVPGFALHDELQSLNRAGMTPAQALYSATAAVAKAINSNAGVVEEGRRADLILLTANPLIKIENTTAIDTVILNGRVLDRAMLDEMLEAVKTANASSRTIELNLD